VLQPATHKHNLRIVYDREMVVRKRRLKHFTILSAQKELAEAKQRVVELESIIQLIQENQEQRALESSLLLQGEILQLMVDWLRPTDVSSCLQVCSRWRHELDNPLIWKRAVARTSPALLRDMEAAEDSASESDLNYKGIAMALACPAQRPSYSPLFTTEWIPDSTLPPQQIFLLMEVRDKKTGDTIGSWHQSFIKWKPNETELGFKMIKETDQRTLLPTILDGTFDHHFGEFYDPDPTNDVPTAIYDSVRFTFHCLRCDTGQSLRLGFDEEFDRYDADMWAYFDTDIGSPTAKNDAGCRARELWSSRNYSRGGVCIRYHIRPVFPGKSENDPDRWRTARYVLDSLECDFVAYRQGNGSYEDYHNLQELLLCLGGFGWQ
jgi:hypothetical protein